MKWPPWRSRTVERDRAEAARRRVEATDDLAEAIARVPETKRLADSVRDGGRRNHFSEAMAELFRGNHR